MIFNEPGDDCMIQSIFVGHGAPTIIWEENEYTDFLKNYSKTGNVLLST